MQAEFSNDARSIDVIFESAVTPGDTVTIAFQAGVNPPGDLYTFSLTAIPAGPNPIHQMVGVIQMEIFEPVYQIKTTSTQNRICQTIKTGSSIPAKATTHQNFSQYKSNQYAQSTKNKAATSSSAVKKSSNKNQPQIDRRKQQINKCSPEKVHLGPGSTL